MESHSKFTFKLPYPLYSSLNQHIRKPGKGKIIREIDMVGVLSSILRARIIITTISFFFFIVAANSDQQINCSKTCVAQDCNSVGIRYGKFCGVGWTGCPGQKPCDDLDACCKVHDECVEKKGMMSVKCHEKFKNCIRKVQKSGKTGFSQVCPYETAMPTMIQGMDMAIMLSQLGSQRFEL